VPVTVPERRHQTTRKSNLDEVVKSDQGSIEQENNMRGRYNLTLGIGRRGLFINLVPWNTVLIKEGQTCVLTLCLLLF
jgi:hypothetical protein